MQTSSAEFVFPETNAYISLTHSLSLSLSLLLLLPLQFVTHFILLAGVNIVGVFYNYLEDLAQRKSFSETRRYIRSLLTIEDERRQKV